LISFIHSFDSLVHRNGAIPLWKRCVLWSYSRIYIQSHSRWQRHRILLERVQW